MTGNEFGITIFHQVGKNPGISNITWVREAGVLI